MPTPEDKTGIGRLIGKAKRKVAQRFGPTKIDKKDMIGSWVQHGLSQKQIEMESVLQVIAGSDSTITAVRSITMFIITHPKVYARLQAELDQAEILGSIIQGSEAMALPYLQACINEGLRVFPPVTGPLTKVVPEGGDTLNGQYIPGGTNIIYAGWDFYKRRDIFGQDADIFRPERWLEATGDRLAEMQRTNDLIFGYGRYGCLGRPVALLEIYKVIAELFRRYDIVLVDPTKPWTCYNRNGFFFQSNMWVRISDRSQQG
jgi:cytochrome P450